MKVKAVRTSLAAVLGATLMLSLLPSSYAARQANQTEQSSVTRVRRGKNGGRITKNSSNQESAKLEGSAGQPSKPEELKTKPRAQDNKQQSNQSTEQRSEDSGRAGDSQQDSATSRAQQSAPPFDRPPLGTQNQPAGRSSDRGVDGSSAPSSPRDYSNSRRSNYPDSGGRTSTRPQQSTSPDRDQSSDASSHSDVDRRRGGGPPVLQRPSDSRPRDEGDADRRSGRPPVLQRPSDSRPRDDRDPDISAEKPSTSDQQTGDDEVIKLESTLVNIPLLVSDRSGRYIPQLSARDFALYEDGVQQTIASFGSEEVPFSVVLLLDVSPSVAGSTQDIQDAALAFVRQLRAQDRVMVASFDRRIHYLSDFTSDRRELEWAIRRVSTGGGTSVYDAVYESVEQKLRNVEGRKALILFSDGEDTTSSRASYDEAVELVSESDVLVYGLRYPGSGGGVRVDPWPRNPIPGIQIPFPFPWPWPRRRRGPFRLTSLPMTSNAAATSAAAQWPRRGGGDFMKDITAAGGGPVYDAERIGDLSRLAQRIAEELRHVYVLSYYPSNSLRNGGYRRVRVSVKARDNIAVRHRPGYNARPNGSSKTTT